MKSTETTRSVTTVWIDEATVRASLDTREVVEIVERTFAATARGNAYGPPRAVLRAPNGWLGAMPAFVDAGGTVSLGTKIVTAFPENAQRGAPTHQAVVLMLDPQTGGLLASVEGEYITEVRTAAASVVATRRLAARPSGIHAILGAGAQARAHLGAFADLGMISSLRLWSRDRSRAEALARDARARGLDVTTAPSANEAVAGADVITTVTASAQPIVGDEAIRAGAHVNAVGACVPDRRELPAGLIARARIIVDSREGALREAGDILLAVEDGALGSPTIAGELGEVLVGRIPGRTSPTEITVFESLGIGVLDVATAALVLRGAGIAPTSANSSPR